MRKEIEKVIIESINTKQHLLENNRLIEQIELLSNKIVNCFKNNGKK